MQKKQPKWRRKVLDSSLQQTPGFVCDICKIKLENEAGVCKSITPETER